MYFSFDIPGRTAYLWATLKKQGTPKRMALIGVELVSELIKTTILSGKVEGFDPMSLLLIAAPESGKTTIVEQNRCKAIAVFSDVTGRGLVEVCKMSPELTHIVINDMVAVMSHRQSVNHYTIAMLNAITEEGLRSIAFPGSIENHQQNGRRGVIACLTQDLAKDGRSWWHKTGFATRMLPFGYDHSPGLQIKIKSSIIREEKKIEMGTSEFLIPDKPLRVFITPKQEEKILQITNAKATELGEKGYRRLKQFRVLVRAHAMYRGNWKKPTVNDHDIEFLQRIQNHISYKRCNPL